MRCVTIISALYLVVNSLVTCTTSVPVGHEKESNLLLFNSYGWLSSAANKTEWTVQILGMLGRPIRHNPFEYVAKKLCGPSVSSDSPTSICFDQQIYKKRLKYYSYTGLSDVTVQLALPEQPAIGDYPTAMANRQAITDHQGFINMENISLKIDPALATAGSIYHYTATVPRYTMPPISVQGHVSLIGRRGISFVYDIDDTLKHFGSGIPELLKSLTLRPYQPIQDMRTLVWRFFNESQPRQMDDRFDQPAVHYVTGGMWQIVPSIQQFLQQFNYPPGAFAVNRIDLNSLGAIWKTMRRYSNMGRSKLVYIRSLLDRFPERRFILVGDTVLMDPEMLADLVKDYPVERVPHVFIRRVKRSITVAFKPQPEEYFRGLDPSRWTLFTNASELAAFNMRNYLNGFYK